MKTKLLTAIAAALFLVSCSKSTFNINAELQNAEGKTVYLKKMVENEFITIDSTIVNNNIANFDVEFGNPTTYYSIRFKDVRFPINFFSENQDVKITADIKDRQSINIVASEAQQLIDDYNNEVDKFNKQYRELMQQYEVAENNNDQDAIEKIELEYSQVEKNNKNYISLFMTKNNDKFVAPYILYSNRYQYELNELEDFANNFVIAEESNFSKLLNDYIAVLQRVDIGQPYIDITQETPEGDMMSVSQLVGKTKLLMIDFWASWCGPCRAENPNIVDIYNTFHEKSFDVIGVSLDENKESWVKAIENDGLVWHHISDLKRWDNEGAKMYGISSIPSNVLIDADGIIVAKNLTGEDLKNFISDYLK